jgi:D-arabinose 1-dehydrogenase-like Zn-dependent alcohol dehydrogenase
VKAWQFVGDGMPLTRNDVAEPVLREGWVIVRVLGTGLCHADVAFIDGDIPSSFMRHVPMTIGHEVAGVVVAVGESVTGLAAGDRVGVRSGPGGAGWGLSRWLC